LTRLLRRNLETDMQNYAMLIDGKLVDGQSHTSVLNPATEEVVGESPVASEAQLDLAVEAANRAFPAWSASSVAERAECMAGLVDVLQSYGDEFAKLLTLEQGKPLSGAKDEVLFSQLFATHFMENAEMPPELLFEDDTQRVEIHRRPLGVVAGICPWNFPLLTVVYKIAPALMTGNTVIIKPSPTTPLTALRLAELAQDIFPPGVLNIVTDDNNLGPKITGHPGIAKVSFTGSTPTGKHIMANAAGTLKRLTLELGGNDGAIVLDDVDPKSVAQGLFGAAFLNSGQVCIALKRLYVHDSVYDDICEELAALAGEAVVGDGMDEATQFGPVQNRAQYEKVRGLVADAAATGNIIAGGEVPEGPGYFVPITIVRDVEDGSRVVDEEQFGPILPIIRYSDIGDVIRKVNRSPFGLGGSIWSSDINRAHEIACQINSGTVWINQHCAFGPQIPFPPAKESGIGVEWGREGLLEFSAMQVINISKG
jgi:acyl-CoA reductase-like NAD-dependent aldehyde dehydrogenase